MLVALGVADGDTLGVALGLALGEGLFLGAAEGDAKVAESVAKLLGSGVTKITRTSPSGKGETKLVFLTSSNPPTPTNKSTKTITAVIMSVVFVAPVCVFSSIPV